MIKVFGDTDVPYKRVFIDDDPTIRHVPNVTSSPICDESSLESLQVATTNVNDVVTNSLTKQSVVLFGFGEMDDFIYALQRLEKVPTIRKVTSLAIIHYASCKPQT